MRLFVALTALLTLMALGAAAEDRFSIAGRVTSTDQEMQEGYFAIDQETMVVTKPRTPLHRFLRSQVGHRVRITIEPADDESPDSTR